MVRDAADLAGQDVDADNLLLIDVPRGDEAVAVVAAAVEGVATVLRRGEGPVLQRPPCRGREMSAVRPTNGDNELVVGQGDLLGLGKPGRVVGDVDPPDAG